MRSGLRTVTRPSRSERYGRPNTHSAVVEAVNIPVAYLTTSDPVMGSGSVRIDLFSHRGRRAEQSPGQRVTPEHVRAVAETHRAGHRVTHRSSSLFKGAGATAVATSRPRSRQQRQAPIRLPPGHWLDRWRAHRTTACIDRRRQSGTTPMCSQMPRDHDMVGKVADETSPALVPRFSRVASHEV